MFDKDRWRPLVSFWELSQEWQDEARSNNDEEAEDQTYIEPHEDCNPGEHYLLDLSEAMLSDSEYDAIIGVSNTSAIGVTLNRSLDAVKLAWLS